MSRAPCSFRQSDVTRLIKATLAAGVEVARVELDQQGKIVVLAGKVAAEVTGGAGPLDAWRAGRDQG